jgi:hypothetical protein
LKALVGALGGAVLLVASGCSKDPEVFCQEWVVSACAVVSKCCHGGTKFDAEECRLNLSRICQTAVNTQLVKSGAANFDSDAATSCLASFATCSSTEGPNPITSLPFLERQGCDNVVTGFAPNGAACSTTFDCAKEGDGSECYTGRGGQQIAGGICAKLVLDPARCSYSFATGELHVCADGSFCDESAIKPNPNAPPSSLMFEFSAPCKRDLAVGESCVGPGFDTCQSGSFCDQVGTFTCTMLHTEGAPCFGTGQCAAGLQCNPDNMGMQTCQPVSGLAPFCFTPTMCGDGTCTPPEDAQNCPQDCVVDPQCGDGICTPPETPMTCPQDC